MIKSIVLVGLISSTAAFFVNIDANEEQCFFERAIAGSKLNLQFEVSEGGFLDVDIKVTGPDGKELYKGERESSGKFTFATPMDGVYTYCFGNKMSTMTPKVIMFDVELIEPHQQAPGGPGSAPSDADGEKLSSMVTELSAALTSVKHEQSFMEMRERSHRALNESTNGLVVHWAIFEAIVLIAMTGGQIWYLKRFFEVRQIV